MTDVTKWVAADVEAAIAPTLDAFVATAQPRLRKCAEAVYEELLYSVQDYLKDNAQWNLGAEIDRCRNIEAENRELRAKFEPFATIPDPQAFLAAARGMREAAAGLASDVQGIVDSLSDCGEWGSECPLQDAHKPDSTIERLQRLLDALAAFDATLGEQ